MKSNFLALDRYLKRYSEKTKKSAARTFYFVPVTRNPYPLVY